MSDEEQERLVTMISNGNNTFAELDAAFPHIGEYEWRVSGRYDYSTLRVVVCNSHDDLDVSLEDSDTFILTDEGKNILYRLKKEERMMSKQDETIKWAKRAFYGMIVIGVLSILTGLASMLLPHLLQLLCPQ